MTQIIQTYNNIFWNLIKHYDFNENNLLRKMIHSFDVAKNCYEIACNKNLKEKERNLCYLIGLFHDIGRFEQWIKYKTYDDKKSVDHGDLSCDILNQLDCNKLFNLNNTETLIFKESIRFHTKPYLGKNKKIIKFNNILKDSDAFSNVISTANGMQQMTVTKNGVTKEILDDFTNRKLLRVHSPKTKLDRCLMLAACCYYVKDTFIRKVILESNYIEIIYETFSKYLIHKDKLIFKQAIDNLKDSYL